MTKIQLADLQLAIMQVLWSRGPSSVAEVREALRPQRVLAYTTVGTMLSKMEEKGYVSHEVDGRINVYQSQLQQDRVSRSMVTDLADRLFSGDVAEMVCHLLDGCEVSQQELSQLKKMIRAKEQELKNE